MTDDERRIEACHPACRFCNGAHDPRCHLADDHDGLCRDALGSSLTVLVPVAPDYYLEVRKALFEKGRATGVVEGVVEGQATTA